MGKSSGKSDPDLERWIRWLKMPFTKAEKVERVEFYRERGVVLEFGDGLVEVE